MNSQEPHESSSSPHKADSPQPSPQSMQDETETKEKLKSQIKIVGGPHTESEKISAMLGSDFDKFNKKYDSIARNQNFLILDELQGLLHYICKVNPFYLISACLILYAQILVFNINSSNVWIDNCIPLTVMACYTILMVATAVFIVRIGKVWDDARTIILICLFLFLAVSVGLDGFLMDNYKDGFSLITRFFVFTVILSEILICAMPIRLPLPVRTFLYLVLAVFYFYPCLPVSFLKRNYVECSIRAIAWFPAVCGLLYLTLLPIIRRGKDFFHENKTPWLWPYFPWTIFLILGFGICARTYLMSLSFHGGRGFGPYSNMVTGFGMYMLIPFLLCSLVLVLEHYIVTGQRVKQSLLLLAPVFFWSITVPSLFYKSNLFKYFFDISYSYFGSPVAIAVLASVVFFTYSWIRKVKYANLALLATVALIALFDLRAKTSFSKIGIPSIVPWLICSAYLIWSSYRTRKSPAAFAGSLCLVIGVATQMRSLGAANISIVFMHLITYLFFIVSILFKDKLAGVVQNGCSVAFSLLFFLTVFTTKFPFPNTMVSLKITYLALIVFVDVFMFLYIKNNYYLAGGAVNVIIITLFLLLHGYQWTRSCSVKGSQTMFWGILSFWCAFAISLYKGQIFSKLYKKLQH